MIFSLAKIASVISDFNVRRLTDKDFFDICWRENIRVEFDHMPELHGFICRFEEQNYIFLDNQIRGFNFLYIAFHELAHYFLHEPKNKKQVRFYSLARPSKEDDEADGAALICLFPRNFVEQHLEVEPIFETDFERQKFVERLAIYNKFKV